MATKKRGAGGSGGKRKPSHTSKKKRKGDDDNKLVKHIVKRQRLDAKLDRKIDRAATHTKRKNDAHEDWDAEASSDGEDLSDYDKYINETVSDESEDEGKNRSGVSPSSALSKLLNELPVDSSESDEDQSPNSDVNENKNGDLHAIDTEDRLNKAIDKKKEILNQAGLHEQGDENSIHYDNDDYSEGEEDTQSPVLEFRRRLDERAIAHFESCSPDSLDEDLRNSNYASLAEVNRVVVRGIPGLRRSAEDMKAWISSGFKNDEQAVLTSCIRVAPRFVSTGTALWQAAEAKVSHGNIGTMYSSFGHALSSFSDVHLVHPGIPSLEQRLRILYCVHMLTHVYQSATRRINNDKLLKEKRKGDPSFVADVSFQDQGFSRPRALVLVPMKNAAFDLVDIMIQLFRDSMETGASDGRRKSKFTILNKERFRQEFGYNADPDEEADFKKKPADYQHIFRGNLDDDFRIGIGLTKGSMKLFSSFYESDIIIASPLGLRRLFDSAEVGSSRPNNMTKTEDGKKTSQAPAKPNAPAQGLETSKSIADFLSSIELCIVDNVEVLCMQNWEHITTVFDRMNSIPFKSRDTDFSRVRELFLNGMAKHYRQTIFLSSYDLPLASALFRKGKNLDGKYYLNASAIIQGARSGFLQQVLLPVQQTFARLPGDHDPVEATDARFRHFITQVLPRIANRPGCLLFIPSYFDFVRVRNHLLQLKKDGYLSLLGGEGFSFNSISEYTNPPDVSRARSYFYTGKLRMLIYTERAHFFSRHIVRGVQNVVFYAPPEYSRFYAELVNWVGNGKPNQSDNRLSLIDVASLGSSLCLFDKYDILALTRIVGIDRAKQLIDKNSKPTFLFK